MSKSKKFETVSRKISPKTEASKCATPSRKSAPSKALTPILPPPVAEFANTLELKNCSSPISEATGVDARFSRHRRENLKRQFCRQCLQNLSWCALPPEGGRRYLPYAFIESGGAMLSSVLRPLPIAQRAVALFESCRWRLQFFRHRLKIRQTLSGISTSQGESANVGHA